ncbi:hypothetical protein PFISCL1PPCAC_5555 [Pristionchus fissidentatus]|uniref:Uncharacterized protein n=1 Tax=Pristionchus fissidentatus TaxID=1538716 RepID=A0AAV5V7L1_9BILA|nr:hypothetical protein PFISCL1PPCAC_5555 [Pristionchus fissidentatus]
MPLSEEGSTLLSGQPISNGEVQPSRKGANSKSKSRKQKRHDADTVHRERFTYENMLVRYGRWKNIRGQIFAYMSLLFAVFIYKAHCDFADITDSMRMITEGRHVHCCCDQSKGMEYLKEVNKQFEARGFTFYGKYLVCLLFSIGAPFMERYIGRRRSLLVVLCAGVPLSIMLMFAYDSGFLQIVHMLLNTCTIVSFFVFSCFLLHHCLSHFRKKRFGNGIKI